jgi:hypothetical protein
MSEARRTAGHLSRVSGKLRTQDVDCSQWDRDRSVPRSNGKLVRVCQPTLAADAIEPRGRLELVITFAADVRPAEVWQEVNRLLQVVALAAPDLKLTYDALHSRAENGDLVVSLMPADPADAAARLDALTTTLRAAAGKGLEIRGIRVAA